MTTYPMRRHFPNRMMEQAMAQRKLGVSLKPGKARAALTITHPNAAGIDIGSAAHFVAVPPDRDDEPVREFPSFTTDLQAIADWLRACGVDTVAMESTGVYWIPLYELLESRGFTVLLVNARHVKNVSGRKSDVLDCQWLQQLLTFGLLRGAFRPADQVCVLRALWRQRGMLLRSQGRHVQHMQKALTQMNIQLANVISDVAGETGQKILRAIVGGERDGQVLAKLKNVRIRASTEVELSAFAIVANKPAPEISPIGFWFSSRSGAGRRVRAMLWHASSRVCSRCSEGTISTRSQKTRAASGLRKGSMRLIRRRRM